MKKAKLNRYQGRAKRKMKMRIKMMTKWMSKRRKALNKETRKEMLYKLMKRNSSLKISLNNHNSKKKRSREPERLRCKPTEGLT